MNQSNIDRIKSLDKNFSFSRRFGTKGNYEYIFYKLNKNVIYYGLENGKKDNGIDLIIEDEKNITFVQCKNWVSNDHYKINQKDLRAFIGNCYMFNNNIDNTISIS